MYDVIHSEARFIIVNKHPGISVHRDDAKRGLVMQLEQDLGCKLWLIHRLDRMTSGILVLAKNADVAAELSAAFRNREVEKYYLALSDRKPSRKQGQVTGDMQKGRRGGWLLLRSRENPAVTEFYSQSLRPGIRIFLCHPHTGKTHQIRVALKSLGAPIIGDPLYFTPRQASGDPLQPQPQNPMECGLQDRVNPDRAHPDRGYLHAWQLAFRLQGELFRFECAPSGALFAGCEKLLEGVWKRPETLNWRKPGKLFFNPDNEVCRESR